MNDHPAVRLGRLAAACVVSIALLAACAGARSTMSFAAAGFDEDPDDLPPPPIVRAPTGTPVEAIVEVGPEAKRLDAALMKFAARQRLARARAREGAPFERPASEAWHDVFLSLDEFLALPAGKTPPLQLARASVTLDAELELDRRQYAEVPGEVSDGAHARLTAVGARAAAVRRQGGVRARVTAMAWPLAAPIVTSLFGDRVDPMQGEWQVHRGIDIAAYKGELVTAAAAGTVAVSQWFGGHGLHVEVEHPSGDITRYSHLSLLLAGPGVRVAKGDPLGLAGSTGKSTGPHVHFEVWRAGRPVDPLDVLAEAAPRPTDTTRAAVDGTGTSSRASHGRRPVQQGTRSRGQGSEETSALVRKSN